MIGFEKNSSKFDEYCHDESHFSGSFTGIAFPECREELIEAASACLKNKIPVTIQGARTGICGCGVPVCGHLISVEKMNHILGIERKEDQLWIKAEPGVRLSDIEKEIRAYDSCFAFYPDPTEKSATAAGAFSCNARGMNAFVHGGVGDNTVEIEVMFMDGSIHTIHRNDYIFDEKGCRLPNGLYIENVSKEKTMYHGPLSVGKGTDLLDVLSGSEGELGIILSLTFAAKRKKEDEWGVLFFFSESDPYYKFVCETEKLSGKQDSVISALEFYHRSAIWLVNSMRNKMNGLNQLPPFPDGTDCAVYVEISDSSCDMTEEALMTLMELYEQCGGKEENTWAGNGQEEMTRFRVLRHAFPEACNVRVSENRVLNRDIKKIGLDFSFADEPIESIMAEYERGLKAHQLEGVLFGHVLEKRIHVNLFAKTREEMKRAEDLISDWAEFVKSKRGCLASENGIGKLKKKLILSNLEQETLRQARIIKGILDPDRLLNPGNVLGDIE